MDERMTLEEVRDKLRKHGVVAMTGNECFALADAIDAHLAQPAQAVDVDAVREVVAKMKTASDYRAANSPFEDGCYAAWIESLIRAIGNAQAEE